MAPVRFDLQSESDISYGLLEYNQNAGTADANCYRTQQKWRYPMKKRVLWLGLVLVPSVFGFPLVRAASQQSQDAVVQPHVKAVSAMTAAQNATRALLQEAHKEKPSVAVLKRLVRQGANVNAQDENGYSAIVLTALHGDLASSQFLVAHGAQVKVRDRAGYTPLLHATFSGNTALVKLFLAHGANANDKALDGSGRRALSLAVQSNKPQMVAALLARGANPNSKQNMELMGMSTPLTPLKYILLRPSYYGYDNTPYGREQLRNEAEIKQLLLKAGART
jgi:hypothetical protein